MTASAPPGQPALRDATPPRVRVVDRALRLALGLASGAGLAWGIWRFCDGSPGGLTAGVMVGVATIAAWLLCEPPDDPGRGWLGRVSIPRPARALGELAIIGTAAAAIWLGGSRAASETLLTVAGLHLFLSWERVAWLLGWRRRAVSHAGSADEPR